VTIFNLIVYNFFFTEEGKGIDQGKFKFGIKQFYKGRIFTMETSPLPTCLILNFSVSPPTNAASRFLSKVTFHLQDYFSSITCKLPWLKKIIWVIGVRGRTFVSDWRFDNLCGSHLQSHVYFHLELSHWLHYWKMVAIMINYSCIPNFTCQRSEWWSWWVLPSHC